MFTPSVSVDAFGSVQNPFDFLRLEARVNADGRCEYTIVATTHQNEQSKGSLLLQLLYVHGVAGWEGGCSTILFQNKKTSELSRTRKGTPG